MGFYVRGGVDCLHRVPTRRADRRMTGKFREFANDINNFCVDQPEEPLRALQTLGKFRGYSPCPLLS